MDTDTISRTTSPEAIIPSSEARQMVASMLLPGENLVHLATISSGIYWKGIAMLVVSLIALFYSVMLCVYFMFVGAILLGLAYSTKKYLMLAATDHRVIISGGLLSQEVIDLRYSKIESIELLGTLPGYLFNYAGVVVSGTGRMRLIIPFIRDAASFRNDLTQRLMQKEEPLTVAPLVQPAPRM